MTETALKPQPLLEDNKGEDDIKKTWAEGGEPKMKINDASGVTVWDVAPGFLGLLLPMIACAAMVYITEIINVVVIGSLGDAAALAGVGLGNMMHNSVAISTCMGLASGMDTLVSQAYGAGDIELTGRYLMSCKAVVLVYMFVAYTILYFSESLLILSGHDPLVAQHAASYNRATMWGLLVLVYTLVLRQYLQNRWDVRPIVAINFITTPLHTLWSIYLVHNCHLGAAGAGFANCVTWWLQASLYVFYIFRSSESLGLSTWTLLGIESVSLERCWSYLEVGVPAMVQSCSELWFWELTSWLMGLVGSTEVATQTALVSILSWVLIPSRALGFVGATAVGTAIGEGALMKVKKVLSLGVLLSIVYSSIIAVVVSLCTPVLSWMYAPVPEVLALMEPVLTFYAFVHFWDILQFAMGGMLRGMGYTTLTSVVTFFRYYIISVPMFIILIMQKESFFSIWYGIMMSGSLWANLVYGFVLYRMGFYA
mmetsp:Transcript_99519/g.257334  ORF Transcript_99519/g.257334 Transcript_99519/m.257334 type:complete len:482 (+) Transcript_99519:88-1533(+)